MLREGAGGPFHRRKYLLGRERLDDIVDGLRRALGDGKRAYWICPLVDELDQLDRHLLYEDQFLCEEEDEPLNEIFLMEDPSAALQLTSSETQLAGR